MRKLFLQLLVSVDGYFDGPGHELDRFVVDDEFLASMPWTIAGTASRERWLLKLSRSSAHGRPWMAV